MTSPSPVHDATLRPERLVVHLHRMRRTALGLCGSWHDAEDLVQETCAQLLARPRRLRDADEAAYVLAAVRNTHVDRHRAALRRPRLAELPDGAELRAEASTHAQARAREVHGWLDALPAPLREAVVAVDVLGLSRAEAARGLGVPERVLEHRLQRARTSLGARLCA